MHSHKDNLQVLFEDNHIIIVNKRAGDIVQGDRTQDKPLSEVVKEYIKEKYNKSGNVFLGGRSPSGQAHFRDCYFCTNFKSFGATE